MDEEDAEPESVTCLFRAPNPYWFDWAVPLCLPHEWGYLLSPEHRNELIIGQPFL